MHTRIIKMEETYVMRQRGSGRQHMASLELLSRDDRRLEVFGGCGHGFGLHLCVLVALFLVMTMEQCSGMTQHTTGSKTRYLALRLQEKGQREFSSGGYGNWQQAASRKLLGRNATMPLHGAVKDFGYFYSSLYIGTPPKKFSVIVDTGSTMTYVPCSTCGQACGPNHQDSAFDPGASTKQSSSSGILLQDVMSIHDGGDLLPITFGCETRETGEIFKQRADGLFGLGNSDVSVVNQLVKTGEIDDTFSLCFGLVEGDGVLLLGDSPASREINLTYTRMIESPSQPFYYTIQMTGILVEGSGLPIPSRVFSLGYSTVLDSGTTFTYIPTEAFKIFARSVNDHALKKGLFVVPGPDPQFEDVCFGGAPEHNDLQGLYKVFPKVSLQFDGGVTLELSPLNYLFVHTFNSGKYCLGVFDNGKAGTLLGGITFRNILVNYDRRNRRIGFGQASCKELGLKHRPPCSLFSSGDSDSSTDEDLIAVLALADGDCEPNKHEWMEEKTEQEDEDEKDLVMPQAKQPENPDKASSIDEADKSSQQKVPKPRPVPTDFDSTKGEIAHDGSDEIDHNGQFQFFNLTGAWVLLGGAIIVSISAIAFGIVKKVSRHFSRHKYHNVSMEDPSDSSGGRGDCLTRKPAELLKTTVVELMIPSSKRHDTKSPDCKGTRLGRTTSNTEAAAAALLAEESAVASGATPGAAMAAGNAVAAEVSLMNAAELGVYQVGPRHAFERRGQVGNNGHQQKNTRLNLHE
eukprot:jgi/Picsp_1/5845/NSC_03204-R1_pepsin-type aspartyl protease